MSAAAITTPQLRPSAHSPKAHSEVNEAVALEVRRGLSIIPRVLAPWLFYDETGSQLFEQITNLPEYYLTRTERSLFLAHADQILDTLSSDAAGQPIAIVELGAGTASKTGILLRALARRQPNVLYQPIDISSAALEEARALEATIPGVLVQPHVANYVADPIRLQRLPGSRVLALYIGSSIGNFSPAEARAILSHLRSELLPGDALLLGTDLAPGASKSVFTLRAAYDDPAGVTAAFNRNILTRLNRELNADFNLDCFTHRIRWNATESRIEMHLESTCAQTIHIPANATARSLTFSLASGETIHTENSYKFTPDSLASLLADSGFTPTLTLQDPDNLFALTLAQAI